jgi:thiamine kinase-like enzyme
MSGPAAVVELLLPDGLSRRSIVLGSGCPPRLTPAECAPEGPADLAILAPSTSELRDAAWLTDSVRTLAAELGRDGVLYALAPPGSRRRVHRLLRSAGLSAVGWILHHPDWARSSYLIPLEPATARYAVRRLLPLRPRTRRASGRALRLPWTLPLLRARQSHVALAAQRPGARPLGDWLIKADPDKIGDGILVRSKWRAAEGAAVVFSLRDGRLTAVAKLALGDSGARAIREEAALGVFASTVRASGVIVPDARLVQLGPGTVLLERPIEGEPAATLLESGRLRPEDLLARIERWLDRWGRASLEQRIAEPEWLRDMVLRPLARLPEVEEDWDYVSWLRDRCEALAGTTIPLVATHNDLTMSNILIRDDGSLGVLDWEAARVGLPLCDLSYAAVDAVAALDHYADRVEAFRDCFEPRGRWRAPLDACESRLRDRLAVSAEVATFAFHAGWIQHAANEASKRRAEERRPFLEIVRHIASRRLRVDGAVRGAR